MKKIRNRTLHGVAHAQHRPRFAVTQVQVTLIQQKLRAVFLWGDRVLLGRQRDQREALHVQLKTARRSGIGPDGGRDLETGFLRQSLGEFKDFFSDIGFENGRLDEARTVAQL